MIQPRSPFKFLDSYQKADADIFFGREEETKALYKALSGVKHLLVYGSSGSGKTSLVECGLRNQFSDADWFALTIRRGANINASVFASINYALDVKIKLDPVTKMPEDKQTEFAQAIEKLFAKRFQPIYLIFDQFEELLISGDAEEKKIFFTELNNLINYKVPCRILLIMREEFIGHLSEFEQLCPSIFKHRFRVEKMGRKTVENVIYNILEAPKYRFFFTGVDSHHLAETILSKLPDKRKEIELSHVQVFLGELWERAQKAKQDDGLPVLSASLIHDNDNLEAVLQSFLKKQILELEAGYGERVPLELLAVMISEKFTKLQLSEAAITTELKNIKVVTKRPVIDLLKELEQSRIIRTIKVGDETQFEISHDALALVVGQNLTEDMKMREKAGDIYNVYSERQGLFTQDDIDYLRPFQQSLAYPPELKKRMDESIDAIKKHREQELVKTRKRLSTVYSLLGGALLALLFAGYFYINANEQKKIAQEQTIIAEANALVSEAKSIEATDPTLALRLAEQAIMKADIPRIRIAALRIFAENTFYKIVKEHLHPVTNVAFSPDGKKILTGHLDGTAILCGLDGTILMEFKGHADYIASVAFSPDGKTVCTASADRTARLWQLDGSLLQEFKGHTNGVQSVDYSPDGKTICTGSKDGTARLWELNGTMVKEFKGHTATVICVAFSPDGKTICTGSRDSTARLWELDGKMLLQLKGHTSAVHSIAFSPDGKTICAGSRDNNAYLWKRDGTLLKEFKGHTAAINSVAFSPDGQTICTGSADRTARVWELNGTLLKELKGHTEGVFSIAFSPASPDDPLGGKTILTVSWDKTARLWWMDRTMIKELKGHKHALNSAAFSPASSEDPMGGKTILTGSWDSTAILWGLDGSQLQIFKGHTAGVGPIAFCPDGKTVCTGSDKTVRLWRLDGTMIKEFNGHTEMVFSIAISPDGKNMVTGSFDSTAILWSMDGTLQKKFIGHTAQLRSVAFSPDGKTICTASADGTARLWGIDGTMITEFKGHTSSVNSVTFSPDGQTILTGSEDKTAKLYRLDGTILKEFKENAWPVSPVSFSPDGKSILIVTQDNLARLWGLDGSLLQEFRGHAHVITSAVFSPDGNTILTGSHDYTARLWVRAMPLNEFLRSDKIEPLSSGQKETYGIK